jgi:hypothetical protein
MVLNDLPGVSIALSVLYRNVARWLFPRKFEDRTDSSGLVAESRGKRTQNLEGYKCFVEYGYRTLWNSFTPEFIGIFYSYPVPSRKNELGLLN